MRISQLIDDEPVSGGPDDDNGRPLRPRRRCSPSCARRDKLIVVTHENPDGDALGSLIAMQGILTAIGKDCLMFIAARDLPLPQEYRFFPLAGPGLRAARRPRRAHDRVPRLRQPRAQPGRGVPAPRGMHILNIDHHHDNTRFGTVNLVDARGVLHGGDRLGPDARRSASPPTPTIAEALYVGLITDTGRFMYENTGPRAHLMAADLIDAGVDVHEIYRRVYEGVPVRQAGAAGARPGQRPALRRRAADDDRADAPSDFSDSDAEESYSEGVIDHLRAVEGTARRGAGPRDRLGDGDDGDRRKVSLRASDDRVDVSAIARAQGGGGHRQAAGFIDRR